MTQPTLFDLNPSGLTAEALARQGEQQSYEAAPTEWTERALKAVQLVCIGCESFTVDSVWAVLDEWKVPRPPEGRAIAGVLTQAIANGWCRRTRELVKGTQPKSHGNYRSRYESLISEGGGE